MVNHGLVLGMLLISAPITVIYYLAVLECVHILPEGQYGWVFFHLL